jgi:restriction system protein
MSRAYYRVRLGKGAMHATECIEGGFIGGGWGFTEDLTGQFGDDWRQFNAKFRPIYLERHPGKTAVAAGLACGMLWTICEGMKIGDIIFSPDADGNFALSEITSGYYNAAGEFLPQRRKVDWYPHRIARENVNESLRRSTNGPGTVVNITEYAAEIDGFIGNKAPPTIVATSEVIEDPITFALEKHLEDFLVANWSQTELGQDYDIVSDEGELIGQQYPSDTGPIDVLAIAKDQSHYLVVELKRGRVSDTVVGQIQRYMGYVQGELINTDQTVRGVIIALEDDLRLRRALSVTTNIDFYRYQVSFKLVQG